MGAGGILLVGCLAENCQKLKGDSYAEKTLKFVGTILDEIGLNKRQLGMVKVCAAEPEKFIAATENMVNKLKKQSIKST
jgi:F420-non-reducing hydrogenase iron-sulfur subunit